MARKHPEALCETCPLFEDQSAHFATGDGPASVEVAVIGEAPGYQEAKSGTPFVGPSGKLLDMVLAHHGIKRADVYVDNVVACRPSDNRTPTPKEIKACYPRLKWELEQRKPKQVVTLGNTASQTVLGTEVGITTLRAGPPKASENWPGVEFVPTVHPAYCLRTADAFPNLVSDIGKLKHDKRVTFIEPVYKVFDEEESAVAVLDEIIAKFDELVIDIETGLEKDSSFDHADRYGMLCIGIAYAADKVVVIGEEACKSHRVQARFHHILLTKKLDFHNGKFDLPGLRGWIGPDAFDERGVGIGRIWFDTMIASYVVDERPGVHGLGYLGIEILGTPDWKAELARYKSKDDSFAVVPRPVLYKYNAFDCAATWQLRDYYLRIFEGRDRELHDFLCLAADAIAHAEVEGINIDHKYLDVLTEKYLDRLEPLEVYLKRWVANPRSPMQVKAALKDMGLVVADTQADTLLHLLERGRVAADSEAADFLRTLLKHRREQKLYGTYVKGIRKRLWRGRVHPTFLVHGTTTGRLSCRNPNLQNVPRESAIRRQFIPAEGNVFVQADYKGAELRVLCTLAQDEYLRGIFRDGRDLHSEVATKFFGLNFTKDQRVRAKAVVFGLAYGREAYSIAQEYGIPLREAERYLAQFFEMIPATVAWKEKIKHQVLFEQSDLVSPFGRHRRFWLITEQNRRDVVKEAYAFLPQSTASDINLHAYTRLRLDHGLRTRQPVHDSILVECKEDEKHEVAALMEKVMKRTALDVFTDYVPFEVDVEFGHSWGDLTDAEIVAA